MSSWFAGKRHKPILVWKDSPLQTPAMITSHKFTAVKNSINHAFKKCIMKKVTAWMTTEERSFVGNAERISDTNRPSEA